MSETEKSRIPESAPPRRLRLLAAGFIAVLGLLLASEMLYRAFWVYKRARSAAAGKSGYFELYMVGESVAAGEPYDPGITPPAMVSRLFGGRLQGRPIREFNFARRGESVYPQAVALEQALRTRNRDNPGVVLVYTGNSDAGNMRGLPALEWLRENVLSRSMLLGDLLFYAEKRFRPLRVRTLDTYEYHLRRIVEQSLKSGLTPVLTTIPTNISDMDPGLLQQPDISRAAMRAVLAQGQALEGNGRAADAIAYYSGQAAAHPAMRAYLTYRIGCCHRALGRYESAARSYREAADLGALDNFNRATGLQNDYIRALARRYSVPLVDAVKLFEANSPHGLVGNGLFADGHHPNLSGYILLAEAYAEQISGRLHEPLLKRFSGPQDVFRAFSYGSDKQANALLTSGRWLFNVAVRHVWPGQRLKMARACFQKAISLEPENFSAWLALGLTEAAMHSELLSDEKNIEWLGELGLGWFHRGEYSLSRAQQVEILKKLSSYGVPAEVIRKVS
ncbi:MAG: SGNH/GDSL hydrolase family protein, partial [Elusimicrobiota bacterium]